MTIVAPTISYCITSAIYSNLSRSSSSFLKESFGEKAISNPSRRNFFWWYLVYIKVMYLLHANNTNPSTTTPKNAPITITDNSAVDIVNTAAGALVGRLDGV